MKKHCLPAVIDDQVENHSFDLLFPIGLKRAGARVGIGWTLFSNDYRTDPTTIIFHVLLVRNHHYVIFPVQEVYPVITFKWGGNTAIARTGTEISDVVCQYMITPLGKSEMSHTLAEWTPEYRHVVICGNISTITVNNWVSIRKRINNNVPLCPLHVFAPFCIIIFVRLVHFLMVAMCFVIISKPQETDITHPWVSLFKRVKTYA